MYTPVNPIFTMLKWGVRGYTLHGLVSMMKALHLYFPVLVRTGMTEKLLTGTLSFDPNKLSQTYPNLNQDGRSLENLLYVFSCQEKLNL